MIKRNYIIYFIGFFSIIFYAPHLYGIVFPHVAMTDERFSILAADEENFRELGDFFRYQIELGCVSQINSKGS